MSELSTVNTLKQPYEQYINKLSDFQRDILNDMLAKKNAGLSVPMGGGKTILTLLYALITSDHAIVVCSKSLIMNWTQEITKWFGTSIPFVVFHSDYVPIDTFIPHIQTRIVITTPEVTSKFYKRFDMESKLITVRIENEDKFGQHKVIDYHHITKVSSEYLGLIYGTLWGTCIVDEFHDHSNATVTACRSILAIASTRRWALSGTLFNEPKPERILSYYLFIQDPHFPNNLPTTKRFIRSPDFKGTDRTLVKRTDLPIVLDVTKHIVTVFYTPEEEKIYFAIRDLIIHVGACKEDFKYSGNVKKQKQFSGYLLAMINYMRQCLVSPLTPVTTVALECCNYEERDELSAMFKEKIDELNIPEYLNDPNSIISSRIRKAVELADNHDKVVMFTAFRTNVDIIKKIVGYRQVLTLESSYSIKKREEIINLCRNSSNFILVLTYEIGSCGLNLQVANTVILLDYAWNSSVTNQAIARVARQGQTQPVTVYYTMSNTGLENGILKKHIDKARVVEEMATGAMKSDIDTIDQKEMIMLLEEEIVKEKMDQLTNKK